MTQDRARLIVEIRGRKYEWRPCLESEGWQPATERLVGLQSGYTVGFLYPPREEGGNWTWSAEHVPSNTQCEDVDATKEGARTALEQWLGTRMTQGVS